MTKENLSQAIFELKAKTDTKAGCDRLLNSIFSLILETLKTGEEVQITRFGTWKVKKMAARTGRNPKTGEVIQIPARNKVVFRVGKDLREV